MAVPTIAVTTVYSIFGVIANNVTLSGSPSQDAAAAAAAAAARLGDLRAAPYNAQQIKAGQASGDCRLQRSSTSNSMASMAASVAADNDRSHGNIFPWWPQWLP